MIYSLQRNRVYRSYHGGKHIDAFYGETHPADGMFPEEWIASTVTAFNVGREHICEGLSRLEDGRTLKELIDREPERLLGREQAAQFGGKMPILVKLLDSAERLFIQCHPTVPFAKKYFSSPFGKTECWYILATEPGAAVYLGFREGVTREKWEDCFTRQDTEGMLAMLHRIPVQAGDTVMVEGGVPHAIGAGCLLCELQEPTDLMVIPERQSASGVILSDLKMHGGLGFGRMFDCFTYTGLSEQELRARYIRHIRPAENAVTHPIDRDLTDRFAMDRIDLNGGTVTTSYDSFCVALVLEGECTLKAEDCALTAKKGAQLFIGADSGAVSWTGNAAVLVCRP